MLNVSKYHVKRIYKRRDRNSHKGDFGKVLVIGGSKQYTGAPILTSMAALRSGSDMVFTAAPERAANAASTYPDLITYPMAGDFLRRPHLKEAENLLERCDSVVIGDGLGKELETQKFVMSFINVVRKTKKPCVIDADGIKAVKENITIFSKQNNSQFLLTPHRHEFYELLKSLKKQRISFNTFLKLERKNMIELVKYASKQMKCIILLKGSDDIISNGEIVAINRTGNPFMSVGGTGDVLAGICGSLMARGVNPLDSAAVGAFISGFAGDLAAKEFEEGLIASDIINKIPQAIKLCTGFI